MNPFDFFDRKVALTLGPDWPDFCSELESASITDAWRFDALPIDDDQILGPHQSFNGSIRKILHDALELGTKHLLVMEYDVQWKQLEHLQLALSQLPNNWDLIYLGANLLNAEIEKYSSHLYRVRNAWTTHALGYNRKVIPWILDNQPGLSEEMFDNWLGAQPSVNAYVVAPMVAWQKPHYSGIWGRHTDYRDIFVASEARLG
jgi:hypothetical protein